MKISKYFSWVNSKLNVWSFWHLLGGLFLTKVFYWFGFAGLQNIGLVFAMAILWEAIEWKFENYKPYGSLRAWAEDSFLDVFIATACAWWMVL
jgi:hypothetical protein